MPETTIPVEVFFPGTSVAVIVENKIKLATVARVDIEAREIYNSTGSAWDVFYWFNTITDDDGAQAKIYASQVAASREELVKKL